jgi:hypothetical protein
MLILSLWQGSFISSSQDWKCPISVLECVSSQLKSYTILNFNGWANDIRFAKYILENAGLLQDMTIGITEIHLEKSQITEELFSFPRISPGCFITFFSNLQPISLIMKMFGDLAWKGRSFLLVSLIHYILFLNKF